MLYGYEEVPGRGPTDRSRKGLALSFLKDLSASTQWVLDYYGLRAKDNPDLGTFNVGISGATRVPFANPPVYAQQPDFLSSDVDALTSRLRFTLDAPRGVPFEMRRFPNLRSLPVHSLPENPDRPTDPAVADRDFLRHIPALLCLF